MQSTGRWKLAVAVVTKIYGQGLLSKISTKTNRFYTFTNHSFIIPKKLKKLGHLN